jgi:deoxyribonuclease-4
MPLRLFAFIITLNKNDKIIKKGLILRRVGVHTSIAGGLHLSLKRAHTLGCTTMQIFVHNPRGWKTRRIYDKEIEEFRRYSSLLDIRPVFIHTSYLINLASPEEDIRSRSINLLSYEIEMARLLGVEYIVLHPGKAKGQDIMVAIRRASEAIKIACEGADTNNVGILLENTAGQKGDISSTIPMLSEIIERTATGTISGICLDTCHAFQAGYDITTVSGLERLNREITRYLSPYKIELIHLNDSKQDINSGADRHQHIGKGKIGTEGFKNFLSCFRDIPLILETPVEDEDDDRKNLQKVKKILQEIK